MAVTITAVRNHALKYTNGTKEFCTATLAGTYVTGGFTLNLPTVTAGAGSSPYGGQPLLMTFQSPSLTDYLATFVGQVATIKAYTAAGAEVTNGAAVPDATLPFQLERRIATS